MAAAAAAAAAAASMDSPSSVASSSSLSVWIDLSFLFLSLSPSLFPCVVSYERTQTRGGRTLASNDWPVENPPQSSGCRAW